MSINRVLGKSRYTLYPTVITLITSLAAGAVFLAPGVYAQELILEEVLVTAQKREQRLEDVPMSVSAITGDSVNDYLGGSQDIRALALRFLCYP